MRNRRTKTAILAAFATLLVACGGRQTEEVFDDPLLPEKVFAKKEELQAFAQCKDISVPSDLKMMDEEQGALIAEGANYGLIRACVAVVSRPSRKEGAFPFSSKGFAIYGYARASTYPQAVTTSIGVTISAIDLKDSAGAKKGPPVKTWEYSSNGVAAATDDLGCTGNKTNYPSAEAEFIVTFGQTDQKKFTGTFSLNDGAGHRNAMDLCIS